MQTKNYYVYILTNRTNTVLYIGFTGKVLSQRIWEHKQKLVEGFTKRYHVDKLVYYETCEDVLAAIAREKQLKGGSRHKKIELINAFNPTWNDLYESIV